MISQLKSCLGDIFFPFGIAVDSTSVYWTEPEGNAVKKVGINGGAVTTLASGANALLGIAVDATSVYWTDMGSTAGSGAVKKTAK